MFARMPNNHRQRARVTIVFDGARQQFNDGQMICRNKLRILVQCRTKRRQIVCHMVPIACLVRQLRFEFMRLRRVIAVGVAFKNRGRLRQTRFR